jgi:hypothetical protein
MAINFPNSPVDGQTFTVNSGTIYATSYFWVASAGAWRVNTTSTAISNAISGGTANQILYQTAPGVTGFISAPNTQSFVLTWNGSSFYWGSSLYGGAPNQIPYQSASSSTAFIVAPTTASTVLTWSGSSFIWASVTQLPFLGVGGTPDGVTGNIRAYGNIVANYSSDSQFKENVEDIPDAISIVNAIGGKLFDWTDDYLKKNGGENDYFLPKQDFGMIAQDVQAVFPRAVRTRPDNSLALDYTKLCAVAFQAIKELTAKVEQLSSVTNAISTLTTIRS